MIKIIKRFLTGADPSPPSPEKPPGADHNNWVHLAPEERAARTRLAKLFCWYASPNDAILSNEDAIQAAIDRYLSRSALN